MSTNSDAGKGYVFRELCEPHYDALVAYANRLMPGQKADALDLVQEAYIRAFRLWAAWAPRGNEDPCKAARGWLHRIVRNVFIDGVRARDGHRELLDEHHSTVIANTYGVDVDFFEQTADDLGDEVKWAMSQLDADQKAIVVLVDFQGEAYAHVASTLGLPIGTVMSRLHRGRKKLAGFLKDYAQTTYGIGIAREEVRVGRWRPSNGAGQVAATGVPAKSP